jgi:OOP family OmpA-OmpF porin
MKMHQHLLTSALLATTISLPVLAHDHAASDNKQQWVGVFAGKFEGDSSRPNEMDMYSGAHLAGAELGFRFSSEWAVRLEAMRTYIDLKDGTDIDGFNFGVDGMYFWDADNKYVFFGARQLDDSIDSGLSGTVGIGAHWGGASPLRLVTEAGYLRSFDDSYNDFVLKLGINYQFGDTVSGGARKVKDSDGDGVMDGADKCPNTPAGTMVDSMGCDNDADNDGIANANDSCPNTPAGVRVNSRGCELKDDDMDGVLNQNDLCPNTAKGVKVDDKGCMAKAIIEKTVRLNALFDNNSAFVKNPNSAKFADFAAFMKANPNAVATIEGHTSVVGSAAYNQSLSERRAANVREVLVEVHGAPGDRIDLIGYGESRPLNTALTAAAHAENRRVVAVITAEVQE